MRVLNHANLSPNRIAEIEDEKVLLADSFDEFLHNFTSGLRIKDWKFADEHCEASEFSIEVQSVDVSDAGKKPWWKFW